ncbi:Spectrin beta chain [Acropora cervicornis]|uniref:Spectrin beta chain n=1 Tax=Acropora cervicornis TaxID=6130 RepID=A0AAD9Q0Q5_ACRCE|nr:Spectrin beta chain [Acropora cervicornis]
MGTMGEVSNDFRGPEEDQWMEQQSSARLFERSRIKVLADEREKVQRKTFTKWINSHLQRVGARINDPYHDLIDGKKLILLLEILSGEKLPKPSKGRMRIHMLENVDKALIFLKQQRVHLENIGAHDIVDGNNKITLGLIWTIILRFQISDITIEGETKEKRSAKDALLLWCQSKTVGYRNVTVSNFTTSWRDGLAFCSLIHRHRPDLIEYDKLSKSEPEKNLNLAFEVAETQLEIPQLLDAEDVNVDFPDEKSVITYVAAYYHYFAKMKTVEVSGSRIGKVIERIKENSELIDDYERLATDLLAWIQLTIQKLSDRTFANTLIGVQQQMLEFNQYRTQEKPPRFVEKGNLEVQLFILTSKLRANHQKMYNPPETKALNDINKAWEALERAEHERELALREELMRQERLEMLAAKFDRKAAMRETWLNENQRLVSQDNFGNDIAAVEAATKKHEAIETDIMAYEERIKAIVQVADELERENFHESEIIQSRKDLILQLWEQLLELLKSRRSRLEKSMKLQRIFQEMINIIDWMDEIKMSLLSEDYGKHLLGVEDLLQKHSLVEADIAAQADRVQSVNEQADVFLHMDNEEDGYKPDENQIRDHQAELEGAYNELLQLAAARRARLDESHKLQSFYRDAEEEEMWVSEKAHSLQSTDYGHDLNSAMILLNKHEAVERELGKRDNHTQTVMKSGQDLLDSGHYSSDTIESRMSNIQNKWAGLHDVTGYRKRKIQENHLLQQFIADYNDTMSWLDMMERIVANDDLGYDEASTETLLKKHKIVEEDIENYASVIKGLHDQVDELGNEDKTSPDVVDRCYNVDTRYNNLLQHASQRRHKLQDALSLHQLNRDAYIVDSWINEKEDRLEAALTVEKSMDLEECQIIEQRFDGFQQELNANEKRVGVVNDLGGQLLDKGHINSDEIKDTIDGLNTKWANLRNAADVKKAKLDKGLRLQHFHADIHETKLWITEKSSLLLSVEEVTNKKDLATVMILQRRLNSIQRDLGPLEDKVTKLESDADQLCSEYHGEPEEPIIRDKMDVVSHAWVDLKDNVTQRDDALAESGELQRFVIDLDDFQMWLNNTQNEVASEEMPVSLGDAEKMLKEHEDLKDEIDSREPDFKQLMLSGPKWVQDESDLQQQSLKEQLDNLETGWNDVHILWDNRKKMLIQALNHQLFIRDSKQCEAILGQQELFLSKEENGATVEAVMELIKKHEEFEKRMNANDDKINQMMHFAQRLNDENHYASDKIMEKAHSIDKRRIDNHDKMAAALKRLRDALQLQQFIQDSEDMYDWLNERLLIASEETYRDLSNIQGKVKKHKTFEAEIQANKERLDNICESGNNIAEEKPENRPEIDDRLEKLNIKWKELSDASKQKGTKLGDAQKQEEFNSGVKNIQEWFTEIEQTAVVHEKAVDLTTATRLYQKHKMMEKEIETRRQRMQELNSQAQDLVDAGHFDPNAVEETRIVMEERVDAMAAPLSEQGVELERTLGYFQFNRDVDDEEAWIQEKEPLLQSTNYGNNLFEVQTLQKKLQTLCAEIDIHEAHKDRICARGQELVDSDHSESEQIAQKTQDLQEKYGNLKKLSDDYKAQLDLSLQAKQYYYDASEAEAWMSEQELNMMGDERGKDEASASAMLKKHETLEAAIADYSETVNELGDTAKALVESGHPESDTVKIRQAQVDKLYEGLKDLSEERRGKLDETLKLYQLQGEIDDLEQWIAEKEIVAGSQDIGQDLAQVEMLEAARELHKFFHDAKEVLAMIQEKENLLTDDLGRDLNSLHQLQVVHQGFEADLAPLGNQVVAVQEEAHRLQGSYAGDKAKEIQAKEDEVVDAWKRLNWRVKQRTERLHDADDFYRFLLAVQDQMLWMNDMLKQILTYEKAKDVPGVEVLMEQHQNRKVEIDAREDSFQDVVKMGKNLIARDHYATPEINEKLDMLNRHKDELSLEWDKRWEHLQLVLEVMQFARDAHMAEGWMIAQEGYLKSENLGNDLNEVEQLLEKHANFEKLVNTQEERFLALERLTTFELREGKRRQMEQERREREEKERVEREEKERQEQLERIKRQEEEELRRREEEEARRRKEERERAEEEALLASAAAGVESTPEDRGETDESVTDGRMEGYLHRKPTMDGHNKKASIRQWKQFYVVLHDMSIHFFKDQKTARQDHEAAHSLPTIDGFVEVATDYTKRKNVLRFRMTCAFGSNTSRKISLINLRTKPHQVRKQTSEEAADSSANERAKTWKRKNEDNDAY